MNTKLQERENKNEIGGCKGMKNEQKKKKLFKLKTMRVY